MVLNYCPGDRKARGKLSRSFFLKFFVECTRFLHESFRRNIEAYFPKNIKNKIQSLNEIGMLNILLIFRNVRHLTPPWPFYPWHFTQPNFTRQHLIAYSNILISNETIICKLLDIYIHTWYNIIHINENPTVCKHAT